MAQAANDSAKRTWLKATDICERAQVQPYVLRTWEMEFTDLGVVKNPGGPRLYRPSDLERVLRIKQLVFGDGLTLAGARRKLEEERQPSDELPFDDEPVRPAKGRFDADARKRLTSVRNGLRALLTMPRWPPTMRHPPPRHARPRRSAARPRRRMFSPESGRSAAW